MNSRTLSIAVVCAAVVGCRRGTDGEHEPEAVVNAATAIVTARAFTETFTAIGTVEPRAGGVATLSAPSAGRVAAVRAAVGQTVRPGQVLVELDQAPFVSALHAAESAAIAADRANERQRRLANEGIVPRKDAEAAAADAAAKHANLVDAQRMAALATLRSPIGGVVTRMNATLGASVDPAQPLVEVADPRTIDVVLNATPADAGRTRAGAPVALSGGSAVHGDTLGIGTVVDVSAVVDSTQRGVAIRVRASATRRPLKIGETVTGRIAVRTRPNAIVIPEDALVPDGETFKVFVVDDHGVAHEREVTVGGRGEVGVEIAEGLTVGERIVTQGAYAVSDSARVAPLTALPGGAPAPASRTSQP